LCQSDVVFINDDSLQRAETSKKRQRVQQKIDNENIEDGNESCSNVNLVSSSSSIADIAREPEEKYGDDTDFDEEEDDDDESEFETELQDIILGIELLQDCIKSYKEERILIDIEQHKKFHACLIASIISNKRDSCKTDRPSTSTSDGANESKQLQSCPINNDDYFLSLLTTPFVQEKKNGLNHLMQLSGYPMSLDDSLEISTDL
jgi:hypothetical protein